MHLFWFKCVMSWCKNLKKGICFKLVTNERLKDMMIGRNLGIKRKTIPSFKIKLLINAECLSFGNAYLFVVSFNSISSSGKSHVCNKSNVHPGMTCFSSCNLIGFNLKLRFILMGLKSVSS